MTRSLICYKDKKSYKIIYLPDHIHGLNELPKKVLINNHKNTHKNIFIQELKRLVKHTKG